MPTATTEYYGVIKKAARTYLTERIHYDVGPREEEGLIRYYDFLVEDGLAPLGWQPDPLPVEEVSV